MVLRPDELASLSEIEESKDTDRKLKSGLKTAANVGLAVAGAGLSSRILPFLNELIPVDLAMKGINKISPKLGGFLKKGMESGLNLKDGLNFIKENLGTQQDQSAKQAEPPKENRNIIQQYSPELHQFIDNHLKNGRNPLEAGALAQLDPKFKRVIEKLVSDHKTPFSSILQSVYGGIQEQAPQQQQQQNQPNQENADQAIMAALQKVLQM